MVSTPTVSPASSSFLSLRTFFYGLAASVIVLLLVGLSGFFWLAVQNPLSLLQNRSIPPEAAMFVPQQAPMMVSLLVKPDRLESFELATASPGDRRRLRTELRRLRQTLLSQTGLNYEQDIQPWLGDEITLAITATDFDRDRENGQQPGYLLALSSRDPERAREFLQLFWQKRAIAGVNLIFEQYAGVNIIHADTESRQTEAAFSSITASAVVGDRFVLFANHPKVLRDAINNVQAPELSLSEVTDYQQAIQDLPDRQVGMSFVNLPQLARWLGEADGVARPNGRLDEPFYEHLQVALKLDRQGLVADTTLFTALGKTISPRQPQLSAPVGALRYVPTASPLVAAGVNLQQFWQQISTELVGYAPLVTLVAQFQTDLQSRWGLEQSDLFGWVQEFALGLLPGIDRQPPDWFFIAQKTADTAAKIEQLDAIAQQQELSIGAVDLAGQTAFVWTKLSTDPARKSEAIVVKTEVQGVRASVNGYEIFATSIAAMDKVLSAVGSSLADTAEFQRAIAPLTSANDGYLYIDWPSVKDLLKQQLPLVRLAEVSARPLLDNLRSLTVTSYSSTATARRGAIFLRLQDS